jgi:hypothetical protein
MSCTDERVDVRSNDTDSVLGVIEVQGSIMADIAVGDIVMRGSELRGVIT